MVGEESRGEIEVNQTDFFLNLQKIDYLFSLGDIPYVDARDVFIQDRLTKIKTDSPPRRQISMFNKDCHGFIHPQTEVKRVFYLDGFCLDDDDVYKELLNSIRVLKKQPGYQNMDTRTISLPALQWTIEKYFGNQLSDDDVNNRNKFFYSDHSSVDSQMVSVKKDLKGKGMAMCAEKAALAQNLLTFLGIDSELVISNNCNLAGGDSDGHAYNLLSTDKGRFIYDPTNPRVVTDNQDRLLGTQAALYPINEDVYQRLKKGGTVEVEHADMIKDDIGLRLSADVQKRLYGY